MREAVKDVKDKHVHDVEKLRLVEGECQSLQPMVTALTERCDDLKRENEKLTNRNEQLQNNLEGVRDRQVGDCQYPFVLPPGHSVSHFASV